MVQCRTEIGHGVTDNDREVIERYGLNQPEFVNFVSGLRICLDTYFVTVFAGKNFSNLRVEIIDVMLCPCDLKKWENHWAAVAVWVRVLQLLPDSQISSHHPAMAAGITDHVWNWRSCWRDRIS